MIKCMLQGVAVLASLGLGATIAAPAIAQPADTLRVGHYSKAPTRGNTMAGASGTPSMFWWDSVFDTFTRVDRSGTVQPFAIKSWQLTSPTTWRFTFRDDIIFSNGAKNNSANVVAILDYMASPDGQKSSLYRTFAKNYASWKAIDEHTVELTTKAPDPLVAGTFARFYLSEMKAFNEMGVEQYTAKPVTSGPWKVVTWTDSEANFTTHEQGWRKPKIRNIRIVELPESVNRRLAIESGEMDLVTQMAPDDIATLQAAGQAVVDNAPYVQSLMIFTEDFSANKKWGGKPPFADKKIRQAVNYAIDRQTMAKELMRGAVEPASQPATPQTFGYNPNIKPYPYDLAMAKKLMSESSYPNGFNMVAEFQSGAVANDKEVNTAAFDALSAIGIKVESRVLPFSSWVTKLTGATQWGGEATSFSQLVEPMMDASQPFNWYSCKAPFKFVCVEDHMPLIDAAAVEMDLKKREAILQQLMQKAHDDAISISLFNGRDIFGLSKRVKGFKNWNRNIYYEEITF